MTLSIEALRSAFKKDESGGSRPNNYYPFWNIEEGEAATVRFLPDKNSENPMGFLVEKLMHTLEINGEKKSIPCLKMYGEECPICKVSSAFYKEKDEANGKKYWRKKQHLSQALVVEDPLPADETTGETHVGKVRFLALGFQIFTVIKEAFEGGELDEVPYALKDGCNFIIKKTKQGKHAAYGVGSRFARKSTDLTDDEVALAEDQMVDLSTLLPQKPDIAKVEAMLEAALTGTSYADASDSGDSAISSMVAKAKPALETTEDDDTPAASAVAEVSSDEEFDDEADKILAQIHARREKKA